MWRWLALTAYAGCTFNEAGAGGGFPDAAPDAPEIDASSDGPVTAASCAMLHQFDPSLPSGVYEIQPGNPAEPPVQTFCEMETMGGGWTLVQRTIWDFTQSQMLITTYAAFFAQTIGSPEPLHAYRMAARFWPSVGAGHDHILVQYPRTTSDGRCQPLYYAARGAWTVPADGNASIGSVSQSVNIFNAMVVSTTDDGPAQRCVNMYSCTPWTYSNCCDTCPTIGNVYFTPARPAANYLTTPDSFGHTIGDRCGSATPVISSGLYGLDAMEYFVR